jgi:hypothetical protein
VVLRILCTTEHLLQSYIITSSYYLSTVSVNCKDTRIAVQVRTNKPFNGRIYALGRSETCNIDVQNSDLFRLDLTMSGQDCNTQSVVSYVLCKHKLFELMKSQPAWGKLHRQIELLNTQSVASYTFSQHSL